MFDGNAVQECEAPQHSKGEDQPTVNHTTERVSLLQRPTQAAMHKYSTSARQFEVFVLAGNNHEDQLRVPKLLAIIELASFHLKMPTAADVITYVGVPLTVAGLFPIVFNTMKIYTIRTRLLSSIPKPFIPSYKLFVDPSNGKVIVVARSFLCIHPGPWGKEWSGLVYSKPARLRDRSKDAAWSSSLSDYLLAFSRRLPSLSIIFEVFLILYVELYFVYFLLSGRHKTIEEFEFEFSAFTPPTLSWDYLKGQNFRLEPPLLLRRPWMELAANCGFCLMHRTDPYHREERIETRFDVDLDMRVGDTTQMVMDWKVFVWLAIAISVDPFDLRQEHLKFTLEDRHTRKNPDLFSPWCKSAELMQVETKNGRWDVWIIAGKDFYHSVRQALAWNNTMCFDNAVWEWESPETSYQRLGETQVRPLLGDRRAGFWYDECSSADSLSKLDPKDRMSALTAAITWFFYRGYWSPPNERTLPVTQRLLEIREQSLCYLRALEDEGNLESKILGMLGASTGHDASNAVDFAPKVFSCVQSAIQHSDYVGDWSTFRKILRALQTNRGDQKFSVPRDAGRTLERMRDGLGTQVVLPGSATPRSSTDSTSSQLVTTMLQSYDAYNKLKQSFDPHLNQNDEEKTGFPDDCDDMTLLADILLAISDWRELPRTHWPLDEKVDACIRKILDSSSSNDNAKPEDVSAMLPVLEEGLKASEFGIYTSRKSLTVPELLSWDRAPELVYLH